MIAVTLFHVPQWGNVSLIEVIWTVTGAITMLLCMYHATKSHQRVKDVIISGRNGPMIALARAYRRREILRFMQGVVIVGIGIYACIQPNPFTVITWTGIVLTMGLFFIGALAITQSILDAKTAHHVTELLVRELYGGVKVNKNV